MHIHSKIQKYVLFTRTLQDWLYLQERLSILLYSCILISPVIEIHISIGNSEVPVIEIQIYIGNSEIGPFIKNIIFISKFLICDIKDKHLYVRTTKQVTTIHMARIRSVTKRKTVTNSSST